MGPLTFGRALLVVNPDGEVLAETQQVSGTAAYDFLRRALEAHAEPAPTRGSTDRLEQVRAALRRGEHTRAFELLGEREDAAARLLRADLYRRERRGEEALAELERADAEAGTPLPAAKLARARILMAQGRDAEALAALDQPVLPEAVYRAAVLRLRSKELEQAQTMLRGLTLSFPEDPWAWAAAALLISPYIELGLPPGTEWPPDDAMGILVKPPAAPLPVRDARRALEGGLAWLLESQRDDGSWPNAVEVGAARGAPPHDFILADAALAGRALLAADEREAAAAALAFLVEADRRRRAEPPIVAYMNYAVWSRAAVLWFLSDALDAELGDEEELRAFAQRMVEGLGAIQQPNGGWSYYLSGELNGRAVAQSISFVTAFDLLALVRAREAGLEIPTGMVEAGLEVLASTRGENGTFAYFAHPGKPPAPTGRPGAAGRGVLCDWALLRGGAGDAGQLEESFELFSEERMGIAKEVGKVLMHAGPDGQGCHYPLFDYAMAAEAIGALPKSARKRHRLWLTELLMQTRSAEGSFRDTELNGFPVGTALAVLALQKLSDS